MSLASGRCRRLRECIGPNLHGALSETGPTDHARRSAVILLCHDHRVTRTMLSEPCATFHHRTGLDLKRARGARDIVLVDRMDRFEIREDRESDVNHRSAYARESFRSGFAHTASASRAPVLIRTDAASLNVARLEDQGDSETPSRFANGRCPSRSEGHHR
jgi:hypothetical protein